MGIAPVRHFEPLRPHRAAGIADRYEFTHGDSSVCVYDTDSLDFVKEIPAGPKPDCHATSADNRFLYMACADGMYCVDQGSLTVARVIDTGHVYATNVMPDGDTMLLHDAYGGFFVLKNISDMDRIHIHKRVDVLHTSTLMDTIGGKGHFLEDERYYLVCAWEHQRMFLIDLRDDYSVQTFVEHDPLLVRGDDLVISADKSKAYCACHLYEDGSYIAIVDLASRRVVKTIPTGNGTCGMTMTNDERYVIGSCDGDDAISVIDTQTDELVAKPSARAGFEALGITGYIQGVSIGAHDEVYVYGCSGNGALVRFTDILGEGHWDISHPGGKRSG